MSFWPSRCDSRARHFIHFETNTVANENCENCPVSNINIGKVNFTFGAHGSFIRFSNWNSQLMQNLVFIYYHHRCRRRQRCRCDSETAKRTELIAVTMSSYFPRIAQYKTKMHSQILFFGWNYLVLRLIPRVIVFMQISAEIQIGTPEITRWKLNRTRLKWKTSRE